MKPASIFVSGLSGVRVPRSAQHIFTVDAHVGGEPIRIVIGGLPAIPGATMVDKKRYIAENLDWVRTALMHEPRGHRDMFGAILTEPTHPEAELGIVFMHSSGYANMCGHGTIGIVTAALELGLIAVSEPVREVIVDTPAGLVHATAQVTGNVVSAVTMRNVPSFLYASDLRIELPDVGLLSIDIAFGGNFFALVSAADLGIALEPDNASKITEVGMRLLRLINTKVTVSHPTEKHINTIEALEVISEPRRPGAHAQNAIVFGDGSLDRSPCGTGTCATMAALHAQGKLQVGEEFILEGISGTRFTGRIVREVRLANFSAVVPEVTASGFITALGEVVIDPQDPLRNGFQLG